MGPEDTNEFYLLSIPAESPEVLDEWERVNNIEIDWGSRTYPQYNRQVGKTRITAKMLENLGHSMWMEDTRWVKSAPSVDEGSYWYTLKEDTLQDKIAYECDIIKSILIDKNESYGNSALDPVRIFSDADPEEQLRIQIDHKLSRIQKGREYGDEDTILDLIGYLILLRIARKQ